MTPTHTFNVDLTNPGQFLACCGLLELANCLDPEAMGWFSDGVFHLHATANDSQTLVDQFLDCSAEAAPAGSTVTDEENEEGDEKSPPLSLGVPFALRLDWWTDPTAVRAGFKTWGGPQRSLDVFNAMRRYIRDCDLVTIDLLTKAVAIKQPKPFYFDCRLSVLTTIEMGFSADGVVTTYSPAVEALSLVGLQRFRPETIKGRERETYAFSTWSEPLPASVAAAVAHGLIDSLASQRFEFPFVVRTGGKYKAFGPALPKPRSYAHG